MNVLLYKYLDGKDGYEEFSEEWQKCNTVCDWCKDLGDGKSEGKAREEKNEIRVGDEIVYRDGIKGVVVGIGDDGQISVLNNKYNAPQLLIKDNATKTGRHFDQIEEVLKRMQEET